MSDRMSDGELTALEREVSKPFNNSMLHGKISRCVAEIRRLRNELETARRKQMEADADQVQECADLMLLNIGCDCADTVQELANAIRKAAGQ